jgi:peptide/nickel transport system substrate-binding protein
MAYGIAESLMRVTPEMQVVPGIAQRLEQVDALSWKVTLRDDVTFWDGTKVDAAAAKASLERSTKKQPGIGDLLPADSVFTASGQILTIRTPAPIGVLASSLGSYNLTIKKELSDGAILYTGPFKYSDFVPQQSITLTAHDAYRGGAAKVRTIKVRYVPDVNARVLALQAGDVDIAHALLPASVRQLKPAGLSIISYPFGRQNDIILNVKRFPLDAVEVRRAIALAVDREALLSGVMDGAGTVALGLAPENLGIPGVVRTQKFDLAAANKMLDDAGWAKGGDGIRAKAGKRLAFSLGSYASRAELEPLATAISAQLRSAGIEVKLERFADINSTVATGAFDATMYSYGVAPFGDFGRAIGTLYVPSGTNKDRYSNPQVNELYRQYNASGDAAKRQALFGQMQQLIAEDAPVVYVVNPNQIIATSPKVHDIATHPLENYKVDARLWINK